MTINAWESWAGINSATDLVLGPMNVFTNDGGSFQTLVGPVVTATGARRGVGKCIKLQTISSFSGGQNWQCVYWLAKNLPATISTATVGAWWSMVNRIKLTGVMGFLNAGVWQGYLQLDSLGNLKYYRGAPGFTTDSSTPSHGTLLGTASGSYSPDTFYCVECKMKAHGTTGTVDVLVNGASVLSLTGQNTSADSTTNITQVALGLQVAAIEGAESSGNELVRFGEFYTGDTVGSAPYNDMAGLVASSGGFRVTPKSMSTNGTNHDFTPLTSTNVSQINETAMDGATSYNESATTGHVDTFVKTGLGQNPVSILGVQVKTALALDAAGANTLSHVLLSGGTVYPGTAFGADTTYKYYNTQWLTDPNGGVAFTQSRVDSIEPGYKRVT